MIKALICACHIFDDEKLAVSFLCYLVHMLHKDELMIREYAQLLLRIHSLKHTPLHPLKHAFETVYGFQWLCILSVACIQRSQAEI